MGNDKAFEFLPDFLFLGFTDLGSSPSVHLIQVVITHLLSWLFPSLEYKHHKGRDCVCFFSWLHHSVSRSVLGKL